MTDVLRRQIYAPCGISEDPQGLQFDDIFSQLVPNAANMSLSDSSFTSSGNDKKKKYNCQRCLNHGIWTPRKNHKSECPYTSCECSKCSLVERRRCLNAKLNVLESQKPKDIVTDLEALVVDEYELSEGSGKMKKGERIPNCQKCGQHNVKNRLKGHKRACPYKDCDCKKCEIVSERQKLMADQIKIRRRQRKDSQSACVRDHLQTLTAAINAASNGLQFPSVNNMNMQTAAFLYNLKTVPQSLLTSPASSDGSSYSPTALNSFNSSPDLLKNGCGNQLNGQSLLLQASNPPSPQGILAPVAINPIPVSAPATLTPTSVASVAAASAFTNFPFLTNTNELFLNILANYKLFETMPKFDEPLEMANIDVCTV